MLQDAMMADTTEAEARCIQEFINARKQELVSHLPVCASMVLD